MNQKSSKKKWGALLVLLILLFIGVGVWYFFLRIDRSLIGDAIVVRRVTVESQLTENAYISIPYHRDSQKYKYINIAVDFNKDGRIYPYELEDGREQDEWIVKDWQPRVLVDEGASYSFRLADLTIEERFDFPVIVMLSNTSAHDGQSGYWFGTSRRPSAMQEVTIAAIEHDEIRPRFYPDPDGQGSGGLGHFFATPANAEEVPSGDIPLSPPQEDLDARDNAGRLNDRMMDTSRATEGTGAGEGEATLTPEADAERIAADSASFNVFHPNVPDHTQGRNECVPTAVANSLEWLARENNFEDKMPRTFAELLQELKTAFMWNERVGVIVPRHFLDGKHAIVERRELPIDTHQVGGRFDHQIVAKIAEELRKGQDVEIDMEYGVYDGPGYTNWRRTGGHMVTVVGAWTAGSSQFLDIHDPASPGPRKLDIYRIEGTRVVNYRYQGRSLTYIRYAVAESPSLTRRTDRWLTPTSTPGGSGGDALPGGDTEPGGVTVGGGPFTFNHDIGGTECPMYIGAMKLIAPSLIGWQIAQASIPGWLSVAQTSGTGEAEVKLNFNCQLRSYTTQDLEANLEVTATDQDGNTVGEMQTVNIKGHIQQ